jgi:hypothetical protein
MRRQTIKNSGWGGDQARVHGRISLLQRQRADHEDDLLRSALRASGGHGYTQQSPLHK